MSLSTEPTIVAPVIRWIILVGVGLIVFMLWWLIQKVQYLSVVTLETIKGINHKPDLDALVHHLRQQGVIHDENESILSTNLAVAKELSIQDRLQLSRLVALMSILDMKIDSAAAEREHVAERLAESHERADVAAEKSDAAPGAAADAAVRNGGSKAKRTREGK